MASRKAVIGTGISLAGLGGLAAAALSMGAADGATPLRPAAEAAVTQTHVVTTVEHRTKRVAPARARGAGAASAMTVETGAPSSTPAAPATALAMAPQGRQSRGADDGPNHDIGDDRGGRGEVEAGDDHGGHRGEVETGDDHGGHGKLEAGDDHGGRGHSGAEFEDD